MLAPTVPSLLEEEGNAPTGSIDHNLTLVGPAETNTRLGLLHKEADSHGLAWTELLATHPQGDLQAIGRIVVTGLRGFGGLAGITRRRRTSLTGRRRRRRWRRWRAAITGWRRRQMIRRRESIIWVARPIPRGRLGMASSAIARILEPRPVEELVQVKAGSRGAALREIRRRPIAIIPRWVIPVATIPIDVVTTSPLPVTVSSVALKGLIAITGVPIRASVAILREGASMGIEAVIVGVPNRISIRTGGGTSRHPGLGHAGGQVERLRGTIRSPNIAATRTDTQVGGPEQAAHGPSNALAVRAALPGVGEHDSTGEKPSPTLNLLGLGDAPFVGKSGPVTTHFHPGSNTSVDLPHLRDGLNVQPMDPPTSLGGGIGTPVSGTRLQIETLGRHLVALDAVELHSDLGTPGIISPAHIDHSLGVEFVAQALIHRIRRIPVKHGCVPVVSLHDLVNQDGLAVQETDHRKTSLPNIALDKLETTTVANPVFPTCLGRGPEVDSSKLIHELSDKVLVLLGKVLEGPVTVNGIGLPTVALPAINGNLHETIRSDPRLTSTKARRCGKNSCVPEEMGDQRSGFTIRGIGGCIPIHIEVGVEDLKARALPPHILHTLPMTRGRGEILAPIYAGTKRPLIVVATITEKTLLLTNHLVELAVIPTTFPTILIRAQQPLMRGVPSQRLRLSRHGQKQQEHCCTPGEKARSDPTTLCGNSGILFHLVSFDPQNRE
jgi:hypothetical protein